MKGSGIKGVNWAKEEIGSTNLPDFVQRHSKTLKADVAVLSDTRMLAADRPVITVTRAVQRDAEHRCGI